MSVFHAWRAALAQWVAQALIGIMKPYIFVLFSISLFFL